MGRKRAPTGHATLHVVEHFAKLLKVTQGRWTWHHSIDHIYELLLTFNNNYYYLISEIKRDSGRNRNFFIPSAFDAHTV